MKLLILGGTVFLGRHLSIQALERGHQLSLFNRGQSNPDLFPEAEHLVGNRDGDLHALEGRTWDAVIDVCGYIPRIVRQSAEVLNGVGRYAFISTISVYPDPSHKGLKESDAVGVLEDPTIETIDGGSYGPLKAACEQEIREAFSDRSLIIRPGLIVGPDDKTDRFTYWPVRFDEGGEVLVPDRPKQPTQFIDVRDLAAFILTMVEMGAEGTVNVTGPTAPMALSEMLHRCAVGVGSKSTLLPLPTDFLESNGVQPWSDLPLVLPYDGSGDGMGTIDVSKAISKGLVCRELEETARDTLKWFHENRTRESLKAGLSVEREMELLSLSQGLS